MLDLVSPDEALRRLLDGNNRFVENRLRRVQDVGAVRPQLVESQSPFAVILGCSDSRAPAEIIFDQGLGDLFVIRTAGHRVDDIAIASVEFAVEKLRSPLVLVLGHQHCGAIKAAMDLSVDEKWVEEVADEPEPTNHVPRLLAKLQSVIARSSTMPGDPLENAVRENVRTVVGRLYESSLPLQNAVKERRARIVGAYYSLESGGVELST